MFSGAIPREIVRHLRDIVIAEERNRIITPSDIGLRILRLEVEEWSTQIGEAPFGGSDLVQLRKNCGAIFACLENAAIELAWPQEIDTLLIKKSHDS